MLTQNLSSTNNQNITKAASSSGVTFTAKPVQSQSASQSVTSTTVSNLNNNNSYNRAVSASNNVQAPVSASNSLNTTKQSSITTSLANKGNQKNNLQTDIEKASTLSQTQSVSASTSVNTRQNLYQKNNSENINQPQTKINNNVSQPNNFAANPAVQIQHGSCDDLRTVNIDLNNSLSGNLNNQVQFSNGNGIASVSQNGNRITIKTKDDIDFQKPMTVTVDGQQYTIDPTNGEEMPVVRSDAFDKKYTYNGNDLGATYSKGSTTWKIWAPTASGVSLNLFQNDTDPNAPLKSWTPMKYLGEGVWGLTLNGDYKDTAYDYNVEFANGKANETYDPYATACVEGGFRSVVLSPEEMGTNVTAGKVTDKDDPTDEVIGEIHIRDFTNDSSSGVPANLRGTYLGVVQEGTKNSSGQATGLDYLKQQGINTVQIQPMYQYDDDGKNTNSSYQYDWGYDPENYNVPEGWYSTNRDDPATRIKECKEMVQKLHDNGIRVNMDVVYNHVADHGSNALAKTVPGYYFRYGNNGQLTNASDCGNDVASERSMVRNYILHSVKYWHDVYGIDGFRFDLMGNLDVTTMNDIRKELPDVVLYGEGWNMGASIPDSDKADQTNENKMPTIGSFNGWGRTVLRGDDNGKPYGYITGDASQKTMSSLGNFIYGCQNQKNTPSDAVDSGVNYVNPGQVINYTECHDNKTLYDVMKAAHPEESDDVLMRRAELGNSIDILNEGVPFLQVGQGFGRSKNGDGNSYRSGDKVNNINWNLESKYPWAVSYEKALIQLRNSDSAFRMTSYDDMNKNMKWIEVGSNNGVIGYQLTSPETGRTYIIAYSNNPGTQQLTGLQNGKYKVLIKDCNGYLDNPQELTVTNGKTDIPSLSCLVLEVDNAAAQKPINSNNNQNKQPQSNPSNNQTKQPQSNPSDSQTKQPQGNSSGNENKQPQNSPEPSTSSSNINNKNSNVVASNKEDSSIKKTNQSSASGNVIHNTNKEISADDHSTTISNNKIDSNAEHKISTDEMNNTVSDTNSISDAANNMTNEKESKKLVSNSSNDKVNKNNSNIEAQYQNQSQTQSVQTSDSPTLPIGQSEFGKKALDQPFEESAKQSSWSSASNQGLSIKDTHNDFIHDNCLNGMKNNETDPIQHALSENTMPSTNNDDLSGITLLALGIAISNLISKKKRD